MGRMTKTRKAYRLAQRVKYEDTKPERVMEIILRYHFNTQYTNNLEVRPIIDIQDSEGRYWTITPDFRLRHWVLPFKDDRLQEASKILIDVDGVYHDTPTQQRKAEWRDGLLVKAGYRVIHVDAELTKNKAYQTYLKDKLALAINSPEKVIRIDA